MQPKNAEDIEKSALLLLASLSKEEIAQLYKIADQSQPKKASAGLKKTYEIEVICTCKLCGTEHRHKIMSAFNKNIEHKAPTCCYCVDKLKSLTQDQLIAKLVTIASLGEPPIFLVQRERPPVEYHSPEEGRIYVEPISLELVEHDKELMELIEEVAEDIDVPDSEEPAK